LNSQTSNLLVLPSDLLVLTIFILMFSKEEARELKTLFWTSFGKYMGKHQSASGGKVKWVNYKTGTGSDDTIFSNPGHYWPYITGGVLRFEPANSPWGPDVVGSSVTKNTWVHVAVTKDLSGNITLYQNGAQDASGTSYTPAGGPSHVYIGSNGGFVHFFSKGLFVIMLNIAVSNT